MYTSVNFLSQAYFIFFIKSKTENQPKFKKQCAMAPVHSSHCSLSRQAIVLVVTTENKKKRNNTKTHLEHALHKTTKT